MSSRKLDGESSSSDESPKRSSIQRETPRTAPKSAPRSTVKATPIATPQSTSKLYASGYKEKVDYSNSKEVHQCLQDLDSVITKRRQELSSIQRSSAVSGGHRRKIPRTSDSPLKTVRNLDKDLSLVDEKVDTNDCEIPSQEDPQIAVENDIAEDKGNEADNSDHESISSISSKGSGAVSFVEMPAVAAGAGIVVALPTVNSGSPVHRSTSPLADFEFKEGVSPIVNLHESFEGDTSHQADTQDSSLEVSTFQVLPETLESPPTHQRGQNVRVIIPSNIESISLPSSSVNNSSFASETAYSDDDGMPSNTVVPLESANEASPNHSDSLSSDSSTSSSTSNGSSSKVHIEFHEEDESDLPDNSRVIHPETFTVDNLQDRMDIQHATVQFGDTRYNNVHLRIDSIADLGLNLHHPLLENDEESDDEDDEDEVDDCKVDGPENNFGIAVQEVDEVDLGDTVPPTVLETASNRSFDSSASSASKRAKRGVEEEFLLGKSSSPTSDVSATAATPLSAVVNSNNSGRKSSSTEKRDSSSSSSKKLSFSGAKSTILEDREDDHHEADISYMSQQSHPANVSSLDSSFLGASPNTSAVSRKASFLESEAKLLKRHLSVYQLKNALLKEEVLQITKMSEEKFQEILQHMQRLEQERDRAKKERTQAQEELLAEQEELLFVRGQLQSKSARVVDLEAELLASQRLMAALQKEAKIWRISSQPNTPSAGNTPTNAEAKASSSTGKRVHFRFSPPNNLENEELAKMEPFQAILFLLEQLESSHPHEKDRLQNYIRDNHREKISLESQVSDLDNKLQSTEEQAKLWKQRADELDEAELEVGRMVIEMESLQSKLLDVLQERDELLAQVQQLRYDLAAKEHALQELETKHQLFVDDYQKMQCLLSDIQEALDTKDAEISAVKEAAESNMETLKEEWQQRLERNDTQVVLISKESDLAALSKNGQQTVVVASPQIRQQYAKPSVYIVKSTGYTCTLFIMLVLQIVILALLLLYLQVNFQMIMLTDNEDIIERLLRFRSTY